MRCSLPCSSKRQSSTFSATSLNMAKLVPVPSYVAPGGYAVPGQTWVILGVPPAVASPLRGDWYVSPAIIAEEAGWGDRGPVPPRRRPHASLRCESGRRTGVPSVPRPRTGRSRRRPPGRAAGGVVRKSGEGRGRSRAGRPRWTDPGRADAGNRGPTARGETQVGAGPRPEPLLRPGTLGARRRRGQASESFRRPRAHQPAQRSVRTRSVTPPSYRRPVSVTTDIRPTQGRFRVVSEFEPSGDQPAAISQLAEKVNAGEKDVVLLGATGTGKSATTAWLIEQVQRPTLVMAPNKTLAAQLANEFRELLPANAVEY